MQMVPAELYEAAVVDGAGPWRRWLYVTVPTIRPVILITTLLSIIMTFADFQVIWILTKGGPVNQTQVLSTYAYVVGIQGTDIGIGAAISLFMFPVLCVSIGIILWLLHRD
jgi:multiple sugar transport system permease protein